MLLATRSVRDHLRAPRELTIPTKLLTGADSSAVQNVASATPRPGRAGHCLRGGALVARRGGELWVGEAIAGSCPARQESDRRRDARLPREPGQLCGRVRCGCCDESGTAARRPQHCARPQLREAAPVRRWTAGVKAVEQPSRARSIRVHEAYGGRTAVGSGSVCDCAADGVRLRCGDRSAGFERSDGRGVSARRAWYHGLYGRGS